MVAPTGLRCRQGRPTEAPLGQTRCIRCLTRHDVDSCELAIGRSFEHRPSPNEAEAAAPHWTGGAAAADDKEQRGSAVRRTSHVRPAMHVMGRCADCYPARDTNPASPRGRAALVVTRRAELCVIASGIRSHRVSFCHRQSCHRGCGKVSGCCGRCTEDCSCKGGTRSIPQVVRLEADLRAVQVSVQRLISPCIDQAGGLGSRRNAVRQPGRRGRQPSAKPPRKGHSGVAHAELDRRHSRSHALRRPVDPAGLVDLIADRR